MIPITFGEESKELPETTILLKQLNSREKLISLSVNISGGKSVLRCSNDDFKFAELPEPRWDFAEPIRSMDEFFSGQHERILIKTAEYNRMMNAFGGSDNVRK